ncbi:transcriptional regulator HexR [Aromatoleum petrolei]|uniref:Transcriptional regulator HexR n=1 Tax=Aromatoleum petrolei TaxID=76116 RepID=A0ABX1MPY9_9RHOO|nr:transcriptional regulator HexR [Aromatoleum petrolei]NMF87207.1 transcriptional regulator HexR [Aromatoleum petrolei]QTQ38450.1 Transcriptional regulator, RpiR family [Aromatoleum petrolei]
MENQPIITSSGEVPDATGQRQTSPLLARIEASFDDLRKSERAVAEFVLAHPNEVLNISIAELAYRVGVSQPTVARFVNALGFTGFKEFKLRLAQSLASGVPYVHRDVGPDDSLDEVAPKVFNRTIGALMSVRNQLDAVRLQRAVELVTRAGRMEFYGIGNSGIVATDAQHKFFRFGIPAVAYSDPHTQGMAATLLEEGDVVVAISASGRTPEIIRACELAREAGAEVIAITASGSPLARAATVLLAADVPEDPDVYAPMTSRIAHLAIIDVLSVSVALASGPELIKRLERTKQTLRDKRIRGFEA